MGRPLNDIEDVSGEDRGILGTHQMLYLSSRPGVEPAKITIEIKRSADNQDWVAFIRQAKAGGYEFDCRSDLGQGRLDQAVSVPPAYDLASISRSPLPPRARPLGGECVEPIRESRPPSLRPAA